MQEKLIEDLRNKFGLMVPEYNYQRNEGIHVRDGWHQLLEEMFGCIKHHEEQLKISDDYRKKVGMEPLSTDYDPVEILQVKEKFGGMRCYFRGGDQYTAGVIQMAEVMSFRICDVCGNKGEVRDLSWMRTLCDKHHEEKRVELNTVYKHDLTEEKD